MANMLTHDQNLSPLAQAVLAYCRSFERATGYSGDFLTLGRIPERKLSSVRQYYPTWGGGEVIALLDCTTFGSASVGMALSPEGITWRDAYTDTGVGTDYKNFLENVRLAVNNVQLITFVTTQTHRQYQLDASATSIWGASLVEFFTGLRQAIAEGLKAMEDAPAVPAPQPAPQRVAPPSPPPPPPPPQPAPQPQYSPPPEPHIAHAHGTPTAPDIETNRWGPPAEISKDVPPEKHGWFRR
jgi:hypothetical protein